MVRVPLVPVVGWGSLREDLAADVRRVADRLRSLSQTRLARPSPPYPTAADAGRAAASALAACGRGLETVAGGAPPGVELPRLSDFAVGDQVAVAGHDLLAVLDAVGPDTPVDGRPARVAVAEAARLLADVRRLL